MYRVRARARRHISKQKCEVSTTEHACRAAVPAVIATTRQLGASVQNNQKNSACTAVPQGRALPKVAGWLEPPVLDEKTKRSRPRHRRMRTTEVDADRRRSAAQHRIGCLCDGVSHRTTALKRVCLDYLTVCLQAGK